MALDKAILHGKEKENLITAQKQLTALVEIMGLVLTALQTDFIKIKKDC